jgi:anti-sigma factor RsiW
MKLGGASAQDHPTLQALSLFAGGDFPWATRIRMGRHIRGCSECEHQVALFRASKTELKRESTAETLTGFEAIADWHRLEREMHGNIAVGVAAARCVDKVRRGRVFVWRGAFAAGLTALFVAGWMTHIPGDETRRIWTTLLRRVGFEQQEFAGTVVRSTPDGIAVRIQGTTLTLMHPASALVTVSGSSAMEARFVDQETGQVTITNVYGQ